MCWPSIIRFGLFWAEAGLRQVDHKVLAPNVCETTYASGLRVVVNYTSQPYQLSEDLVVPAVGYVVLQGGN